MISTDLNKIKEQPDYAFSCWRAKNWFLSGWGAILYVKFNKNVLPKFSPFQSRWEALREKAVYFFAFFPRISMNDSTKMYVIFILNILMTSILQFLFSQIKLFWKLPTFTMAAYKKMKNTLKSCIMGFVKVALLHLEESTKGDFQTAVYRTWVRLGCYLIGAFENQVYPSMPNRHWQTLRLKCRRKGRNSGVLSSICNYFYLASGSSPRKDQCLLNCWFLINAGMENTECMRNSFWTDGKSPI